MEEQRHHMRQNSVVIKSNAYGLIIHLDADLPFEQLLSDVADKFRSAARFFRNAQMAVTFQGRTLTADEELTLINTITDNAQIQIVCLVDESQQNAERYKEAVIRTLEMQKEGKAQVFRGTLKSGMSLESEVDLVILGDVNPGASAITSGNLIVLGCAMGNLTAGLGGREDAFVCALTLKPALIRIADKTARAAITKKEDPGDYPIDPKIALIRNGHIILEPMKGSSFEYSVSPESELS